MIWKRQHLCIFHSDGGTGGDWAGAVKPAAAAERRWPAGPGLRALAQSAIIVLGMRVLQTVAGRGHPGRVLRASWSRAANRLCVFQVQATSPLSSCDPIGRITSHPVGGRHPHQSSSCTRTRGSKGRGHSVRRRLAAKALNGHCPRNRSGAGPRIWLCDLKPSGQRPPERRPG